MTRSASAAAARTAAAMRVRVVRLDRPHVRRAPGLARLPGEHERVGVGDLPRLDAGAERPDLVAGGHDLDHDGAPYPQVGRAGGRRGGHVDGPQPVALGQQQLPGATSSPIERTCWYGGTAALSSARATGAW